MTIRNITTNHRFAGNLTVSRKKKSILKRLKARKPGGHGQPITSTAAHAAQRRIQGIQEMGTEQCLSPMATSHRQSPSFTAR